jgi:hypothetical protein
MSSSSSPDPLRVSILAYLAGSLCGYPFDPVVDEPYVDELLDDFADIDVLEEIKRFRWYYSNKPFAKVANPRGALRRWLSRAKSDR